ncbi:MAG: ComEC/Rec2 family competence protein [Bacteroidia bacterium]|nr:ComEC/Rec2 family competence protein [Bacteroidia bacterium]
MLHKEIPFLRIGLPLCVGIISGLYIKPDTIYLVVTFIIVIAGFFTSLFYNKYQTNLIFGYSLTIALFTCGLLLYTDEKNCITILKPEQASFYSTLSDYPEEKENSFSLTVKLNRKITRDGTEAVEGSMILYHKKDSMVTSLLPGDLLIIKCTPVEIVNRGNPYEFDYKFFMENQGIRYYAFTSSRDITSHIVPDHRKLIHRALIIREKIIWMYKERGITGERLALVAAITLGQKNMLDPEQKQNFIKAGVMHIMAVSGLHAVILSLFVFNLLFFMKRRFNILRILITILILWSFAFVTGLTPSVLRATLMFSFLQAGNLMKRRVNGINSVLASAFILILIKPSVIFDAGFLLSYSAVIYIISFYQDFYLKLQFKNRLPDKIWQSAVVTIVAQAGTLPLTIMLFNRFPTYFILTNIIIVPLSSLLIVTGCLVPLTFPIRFLSQFIGSILNFLTGLTELLTAKASSLPWSTIDNIGMSTVECILLTGTIFLFSYFLLKKQSFSICYPLAVLLLFVIASTVMEIKTRTTYELIVYNTPGSSTIGIRTGKMLNLYADTSLAAPEVKRHCATLGLKIKTNTLKNKFYCIRAGEKKILICNSLNNNILQNFIPDIVILTGLRPEIENHLSSRQPPETLIISSAAVSGFCIPQQMNFAGTDTVHLVRKSGAFIKKI